jgi:hypothetical protein
MLHPTRVIVSLHVATGAAAGAVVRSRGAAAVVGPVLHALGDRLPHMDIRSRRFEVGSGVVMVVALALRHGVLAPETIGALTASAPDLEHIVPLPRPGGRKLFPSHRVRGWHRAGGVPAWSQLLAAGVLLGLVLGAQRRSSSAGSASTPSKRSSR